MSRPPLPPGRRRDESIKVALSPEERVRSQRLAEAADLGGEAPLLRTVLAPCSCCGRDCLGGRYLADMRRICACCSPGGGGGLCACPDAARLPEGGLVDAGGVWWP